VIRQPANQVDEVAFRIDVQQPAVFHQREQVCQSWAGLRVANKQPVPDTDLQGTDRALDGIVRDLRVELRETPMQPLLLIEQVTHGIAERRLGRRHLRVLRGRVDDRLEVRQADPAAQDFLAAKALSQLFHSKQLLESLQVPLRSRVVRLVRLVEVPSSVGVTPEGDHLTRRADGREPFGVPDDILNPA
jgi:hypothetical protein